MNDLTAFDRLCELVIVIAILSAITMSHWTLPGLGIAATMVATWWLAELTR